jgi:2-amino-4-hydroxy-6-hydroxymethyldihydropteridine diphosphokinase
MLATAYFALGSNLGDRAANLNAAIQKLSQVDRVNVRRVSPFLDNPAVGGPANSPRFLNAVAELVTTLSPEELLIHLLEVERSLGRVRREKWGPRTIDLDLLLYDSEVIQTEQLKVPHPHMHERSFVLQPLAELAPRLVHPISKKTVDEMLAAVRATPAC